LGVVNEFVKDGRDLVSDIVTRDLSRNRITDRWDEPPCALRGKFANSHSELAVTLSLLLPIAVIDTPFLQQAFSTVGLAFNEWPLCALVATSVP